jgi:hypothetical protein
MRHKTQAILESGLQIPTGAAAGRVLASDGSGNAAWAANAVADADAYALRAGVVVNGGGQIDVDGTGRIKWGTRFLVMANGRGATIAPGGYFDITMPALNDLHVAAANKDGAVGTASMRTLAVGALAGVGQAMPGYATLDQIANPVAARVMNGQKITGLADPTGFMDGANKQYVDRSASKAFAMAVS